jgi:hypothetical protein
MQKHLTYANVMATLAFLIAVAGGTAYAANTVFSADIVDGEVKAADLANNSVRASKIATGQVQSVDVRDDTLSEGGLQAVDLAAQSVGRSELDSLAFASGDISRATPTSAFGVSDDAIQHTEVSDGTLTGADVAPNSLLGSDVAEQTLTLLDGHDSFDANCDPGDETWIVCDELLFTLGRDMEVSATWVYAMGTDGGVNPNGECRTTLDSAPKSNSIWLSSEDDSDFSIGGVPVVDVMSLPAGTHTIGLECHEHQPEGKDLVIREIGMSAVELGFD